MTVTVNGEHLYDWPVTTGGSGYDTPGGTFKPFRMEIDHFSDEYDNAPMPYSIFFTQTGNAIHGTYEQRNLGRAVSHGCVRLSVKNAATLWNLVKQEKMANTTVVVSGAIRDAGPPVVARSRPLPLTPDSASYAAQTMPQATMRPKSRSFGGLKPGSLSDAICYSKMPLRFTPRKDGHPPLLPPKDGHPPCSVLARSRNVSRPGA